MEPTESTPEVVAETTPVEAPVEVAPESVPEPAPAPEPVPEPAPAPEPVPEPSPAPVEVTPEPAPGPVAAEEHPEPSIVSHKAMITEKSIKLKTQTTFCLTDEKQEAVVACLKRKFPGEDIEVSQECDTIRIGKNHKLSLVVEDGNTFTILSSSDEKKDTFSLFKVNMSIRKLLV